MGFVFEKPLWWVIQTCMLRPHKWRPFWNLIVLDWLIDHGTFSCGYMLCIFHLNRIWSPMHCSLFVLRRVWLHNIIIWIYRLYRNGTSSHIRSNGYCSVKWTIFPIWHVWTTKVVYWPGSGLAWEMDNFLNLTLRWHLFIDFSKGVTVCLTKSVSLYDISS